MEKGGGELNGDRRSRAIRAEGLRRMEKASIRSQTEGANVDQLHRWPCIAPVPEQMSSRTVAQTAAEKQHCASRPDNND